MLLTTRKPSVYDEINYNFSKFMKKFQKGFTLIELIIVIAIIAILAVGIIAALNPVEQSNRANDGRFKNTLNELMSAVQRYYASTNPNTIPFCTSGTSTGCMGSTGTPISTAADTATSTVLNKLVTNSEITPNFTTVAANDFTKITAAYYSASGKVSLCFKPSSQAASTDSVSKYTDSTGATTCAGPTYTTCWFCIVQ